MIKGLFALFLILPLAGGMAVSGQEKKGFDGLAMSLGNLCRLSKAKTRSISA